MGELSEGDKVFTIGQEPVTVKSVTDKGTATVYHLSDIEHTHTYFADGVLVHNGLGGCEEIMPQGQYTNYRSSTQVQNPFTFNVQNPFTFNVQKSVYF